MHRSCLLKKHREVSIILGISKVLKNRIPKGEKESLLQKREKKGNFKRHKFTENHKKRTFLNQKSFHPTRVSEEA